MIWHVNGIIQRLISQILGRGQAITIAFKKIKASWLTGIVPTGGSTHVSWYTNGIVLK